MTETTNKSGGTKRIQKDVATLAEAERIAASWRLEGFRVGTSAQSGPNFSYTGLFQVDGRRKKAS